MKHTNLLTGMGFYHLFPYCGDYKKDISKNATSAPAGKILVVTRSAPSNSEDKAQAPFHQEYKPRQEEVK